MNAPEAGEVYSSDKLVLFGVFMEWINEQDLIVPTLLFRVSAAGKVFGRFCHWTPVFFSYQLNRLNKTKEEKNK